MFASPRPGFRCLEDASDWVDPRGPDGVTIIAQFEQARPDDCPGVTTGPPPKEMMLFDLEADPAEQRDVAAERPEVVARLKSLFDKMAAQVPDELPNPPSVTPVMMLMGGELRYDRVIKPRGDK